MYLLKSLTGFFQSMLLFLMVPLISEAAPKADGGNLFAEINSPPGPVFSLNPENYQDKALVKTALNRLSSPTKKEYILQSLKRAVPFREYIQRQLQEKGLPAELFYLPVIESAFKVNAVSHAGAVGLWQFIPNSSKNMKIGPWIDQRRDFRISTREAAKKLAFNYQYTQDWLLALAAYNCGLGRIIRLLKQHKQADFWQLAERKLLPKETIAYVPAFLAVTLLCRKWDIPALGNNNESILWTNISGCPGLKIDEMARELKIDPLLLSRANAALLYGTVPSASVSFQINIPQQKAGAALSYLEKLRKSGKSYLIHTIRSGDTLWSISRKYKIKLEHIYSLNRGLNPKALPIGKVIIIPCYIQKGEKTNG